MAQAKHKTEQPSIDWKHFCILLHSTEKTRAYSLKLIYWIDSSNPIWDFFEKKKWWKKNKKKVRKPETIRPNGLDRLEWNHCSQNQCNSWRFYFIAVISFIVHCFFLIFIQSEYSIWSSNTHAWWGDLGAWKLGQKNQIRNRIKLFCSKSKHCYRIDSIESVMGNFDDSWRWWREMVMISIIVSSTSSSTRMKKSIFKTTKKNNKFFFFFSRSIYFSLMWGFLLAFLRQSKYDTWDVSVEELGYGKWKKKL